MTDAPQSQREDGIVSRMVHELANISNGLNLHAERLRLLLAAGNFEEAGAAVLDVGRESDRLIRLIEGLRKVELIGGAMNVTAWNCAELLSQAAEQVTSGGAADGVEIFIVGCDRNLPAVDCDPGVLAGVLQELVRNASAASARTVRLSAAALRQNEIAIRVEDDGNGIPQPVRATLFTMFSSTKKHQGRLGLGLWRARTLCRRLGGELNLVESVPGSTCFELRLPASPGVTLPAQD